MSLNAEQLCAVLLRCCSRAKEAAEELNRLDGQLGDGDLGATLEKCARLTEAALAPTPQDIPAVFQAASMACARASGSSFGTLLGVALLTAAKQNSEMKTLDLQTIPSILEAVLAALMARGGASLGDKTVLDAIDALTRTLKTQPLENWPSVAPQAVAAALETWRQKPNKIGRARMFAERSVGLDDPGMVAFAHLVDAATGRTTHSQEVSG
ncbi:MAG: DAK2 domain-containing protein [Enterobacterales bacterium endosymbiont of Blomia tropicalis]|uniref:DAK2 domain-containing protein n=1 Tax=Mixta mediterraneensis TaxID=2758443 RepID=UPI0025A8C1EB|nr:DAK2 domain-containing protein [Mixta mediterraneensis]MDL4915110.1 DAK2 domain-containing protein [Mixta mediterraneensis]